ncbi:aromatic acid exporter family protein [Virgibacillus sp. W0181]|uniref:aromatic acid exporter family protein n=1 Tax=Virgibacillus sp. W0181 TaxID=3391581 RepID=UPI003F480CA5
MKIGYRTIKTAIGTPIAISIAQLFGVTNFVSAGILTILCIQPSRKRSVLSAWDRFLACVLAIVFSIIFFELLGYSPIVVGVMLAIFIPVTVYLKIAQGITTSTVITLNLYSAGSIPISFILDQFLLILIGIGTGLLVNLYMPSLDKKLKEKQKKLEQNFQVILHELSIYIKEDYMDWDGKELTETEKLLEETDDMVQVDRENHLLRNNHSYYDYFKMRSKQFELLQQMLPLVTRIKKSDSAAEQIASFFERLSESVHPGNTAILFLDELKALRIAFHEKELPATKEEFETRASLFQLLHEIEEYLLIKKKFKKSDVVKGKTKRKIRNEARTK